MEWRKRTRSYNFTSEERERLLRIIEQSLSLIECKRIDAASLRLKAKEWNKVEKEFNLSASYFRHVDTLRKCWDNMKKKSRRYFALKKDLSHSEFNKIKHDPILETVNKLISRPVEEEIPRQYQQNQPQQQQQHWERDSLSIEIVDTLKYEDESLVAIEESNSHSHCWSRWSPSLLRQSPATVPLLNHRSEIAASAVTPCISTHSSPTPPTTTISLVSVNTLLADPKDTSCVTSSVPQPHVQRTVSISSDSTTPSLSFQPSPENISVGSTAPSVGQSCPSTSHAPTILRNTRHQPIESTQHTVIRKDRHNVDEVTEKQLIKEKIATEKLQRRLAIREHRWKHEEHLQDKRLKALLILEQKLKIKLLTKQIEDCNK